MSIAEFVLVSGDFMGEWSGDLDCLLSNVMISHVMHSRKKVNPTIINSDVRVLTYIMDADADGFRPILRINVVERFFEGPLNSLAPPPWCPAVDDDLIDDDLNDYENDVDDIINMEDFSMHMEDFSSNSQDDEEDHKTESQAGYSFTDETNFYCGQTFADKKELEMQLDTAAAIQSFDYYMEKSYTKFMKAQCLSRAFSHRVELLNPGSSYSIMVNRMDGSFVYYFLAFGVCIRGYAHMIKVIAVDGTHLYGKHISIANDFSHVYSRAHHGLCMRHLAENLCVNQHCGEHLYLFYTAAKAYSFDEFSDNFMELNIKCPEVAYVLENVLGFEKWSRAHFSDNRYDVMTTNITESLNSILMDEWEYPVSYIFNLIAKKYSEKFRERHAFVGVKENIFVPFAERILRDNKSVNLLERSCSCRKFDLVKMSCEHAMAALRAKYDDDEDYGNSIYDYSSPIYKDESYLLVYSEAISMVPPEAE
ncbi:hypothetical protein BC332_03962 [Capsicum chinense]|nr:hypothetical protein BC332_03962 [Capsicum chinense]